MMQHFQAFFLCIITYIYVTILNIGEHNIGEHNIGEHNIWVNTNR